MMQATTTEIEGLVLLTPRTFSDDRGWFRVTHEEELFRELTGHAGSFVQENESRSAKGVLRGLHYQARPHAQSKLVRVAYGSVLDVCVDLRNGSPTYGQHFKVRIDAASGSCLFIPEGFAHGFLALEEGTIFQYKCGTGYHPPAERIIRWNDPDLGIDWGIADPTVSRKDDGGMPFSQVSPE